MSRKHQKAAETGKKNPRGYGAWTRAATTPRAEVVREPERREKSPDGAGRRAAGKPGRAIFSFFTFYFSIFNFLVIISNK
jgi:hypothetical protein